MPSRAINGHTSARNRSGEEGEARETTPQLLAAGRGADERVAIPLDPETVIEGMMQVDAEKVREAEPKRDRQRKP